MPIRKLPTLLVNQIAAGEVIERPASVVKELLENSLDAGATRVDIAIEQGGKQLIRISDDGLGIPPDELTLAIAPHATSKITDAEQLAAIATFGFRGEALASVASISRLSITSRATRDGQTDEAAHTLTASGDDITGPAPDAGRPGTVIAVRDLFFNTPARRKFLRTDPTEFGHIHEAVRRIAMVHPHVAFSLTHNDRAVLDLPAAQGDDAFQQRCVGVLGNELEEALLEFNDEERRDKLGQAGASAQPARVWGMAGLPVIARASNKHQFLFINGRPIRDRSVLHAVKEAYRGLMPHDKQPVAVVMLWMDPGMVDVNVHPAKSEVRFREPGRIHGLVLTAIRQRLLGTDLTPTMQMQRGAMKFDRDDSSNEPNPLFSGAPEAAHTPESTTPNDPFAPDPPTQTPGGTPSGGGTSGDATSGRAPSGGGTSGGASGGNSGGTTGGVSSFVNYFRRMDPTQQGLAFREMRETLKQEGRWAEVEPEGTDASSSPPHSPRPTAHSRILQIHKSYVVTQDDQGIVIIDQHALHERVMFEQLWQRVFSGATESLESQRLLMPVILDASPNRQGLLEGLAPLLQRIGMEAEPIGPGQVAIHAFPTFLFDRHVEPDAFLNELLDRAEQGDFDVLLDGDETQTSTNLSESALHRVVDMMACKAAVKAGDHLTEPEIESLLDQREHVERSSNCPHGRPTQIRLSLKELEKQFGRA